jgi:hypothetical protein
MRDIVETVSRKLNYIFWDECADLDCLFRACRKYGIRNWPYRKVGLSQIFPHRNTCGLMVHNYRSSTRHSLRQVVRHGQAPRTKPPCPNHRFPLALCCLSPRHPLNHTPFHYPPHRSRISVLSPSQLPAPTSRQGPPPTTQMPRPRHPARTMPYILQTTTKCTAIGTAT